MYFYMYNNLIKAAETNRHKTVIRDQPFDFRGVGVEGDIFWTGIFSFNVSSLSFYSHFCKAYNSIYQYPGLGFFFFQQNLPPPYKSQMITSYVQSQHLKFLQCNIQPKEAG